MTSRAQGFFNSYWLSADQSCQSGMSNQTDLQSDGPWFCLPSRSYGLVLQTGFGALQFDRHAHQLSLDPRVEAIAKHC